MRRKRWGNDGSYYSHNLQPASVLLLSSSSLKSVPFVFLSHRFSPLNSLTKCAGYRLMVPSLVMPSFATFSKAEGAPSSTSGSTHRKIASRTFQLIPSPSFPSVPVESVAVASHSRTHLWRVPSLTVCPRNLSSISRINVSRCLGGERESEREIREGSDAPEQRNSRTISQIEREGRRHR